MADEYGATTNHNLRYPTDAAPIDTAGDIQRLAEDVDGALPSINTLDTTPIYGTGRPDTDMPDTGNEGDRYICTNPGAAANYGAEEWRHTDGEWRCIKGTSPIAKVFGGNENYIGCWVQRIDTTVVYTFRYLTLGQNGVATSISLDLTDDKFDGWRLVTLYDGDSHTKFLMEGTSTLYGPAAVAFIKGDRLQVRQVKIKTAEPNTYVTQIGSAFGEVFGSAQAPWPTTTVIESAARLMSEKEVEELYRQEHAEFLEATRSEDA